MWHIHTLVNNKYVSTLYTRLNKTYTLGTLTLLRGNISNNIVAYTSNATWCSERNCQNYFFKVHIASNLGSLGLSQERRGWINLAHVLQWISSACRALVLERELFIDAWRWQSALFLDILMVRNEWLLCSTSTFAFTKLVRSVQTLHQLLRYKDIQFIQYSDRINKEIRIVLLSLYNIKYRSINKSTWWLLTKQWSNLE